MKILVTGSTGYIGGRLVPKLINEGYNVKCMSRNVSRIKDKWNDVEVVYGDVNNLDSINEDLFKDVLTIFYLIHSMAMGENEFEEADRKAAKEFSNRAYKYGVKRIIYLGGLGSSNDELSKHLKSRQQTGDSLRESGINVIEFRAGMIIGSGSISFEMVRYLTERLPFMICPKWVKTKSQPIAIRDVLNYLISAISIESKENKIYDIGCDEVLSYQQLMLTYAKVRKLKRYMITVPLLTPRLSSYWVDLVTPIPKSISRPLIDGLKNELIVSNNNARRDFDIAPISFEKAIQLAIERKYTNSIDTIWSNSLSSINPSNISELNLNHIEGMILEKREIIIESNKEKVFEEIQKIGGDNGWYANLLWQLRGLLDRVFGGIGMRRGRRHPEVLEVGDPLDFWRVEAVEKNKLLRLRAEMKLPGKAWLQYDITNFNNKVRLIQTAFFEPNGLSGTLYWWSLYFLHKIIFSGMIKQIKLQSEANM